MKYILSLLFSVFLAIPAIADPVTAQFIPDRIMRPATPGYSSVDGHAFANVAASQTDSSIVAAVAGKVIRVLAVVAVAGGTATNLTFNTKPSGAGTAISPLFANGINGGEVLPFNPSGWFQTNSGEGLTVTTGAGSTTGILVTYVTY